MISENFFIEKILDLKQEEPEEVENGKGKFIFISDFHTKEKNTKYS